VPQGGCCSACRPASSSVGTCRAVAANERYSGACSCHISPVRSPVPPVPTNASTRPVVAGFPHAALFLPRSSDLASFAADSWLLRLAPTVPHRILHCSWLI
jgi:hypothetical protein